MAVICIARIHAFIMNGRGAYICANEDCLSKAFKNKGLERSFKMAVDSAVYDELAKELNNIGK